MLNEDIQTYLSDALDQEACKPTLTQALVSRVATLQDQNISAATCILCLENLCDDPYQLNVDVIEDVIESIIIESLTSQ
jgi:hypothetical protein